MHVLNRSLPMYAPDDEQGGAYIEDAVAQLHEQRKATEKPDKVETPKVEAAPEQNTEQAPETGDAPEPEAEQSDEEKIAAELETEQTPASDTKLPPGWSEAD